MSVIQLSILFVTFDDRDDLTVKSNQYILLVVNTIGCIVVRLYYETVGQIINLVAFADSTIGLANQVSKQIIEDSIFYLKELLFSLYSKNVDSVSLLRIQLYGTAIQI